MGCDECGAGCCLGLGRGEGGVRSSSKVGFDSWWDVGYGLGLGIFLVDCFFFRFFFSCGWSFYIVGDNDKVGMKWVWAPQVGGGYPGRDSLKYVFVRGRE